MFRRRHKSARSPRTLIGLYLRASALREAEETRGSWRDRLVRTGWRDADSVASNAFGITVRYSHTLPNDRPSVSQVVAGMRAFFGADGVDRIPQAEGELLMRAALGED